MKTFLDSNSCKKNDRDLTLGDFSLSGVVQMGG